MKLVRHTEQKLLALGEPITALGQQAQQLLDQATTLSDAQRQRVAEAFNVALSSHAHIRTQSTRLTQGHKLRHCKLVTLLLDSRVVECEDVVYWYPPMSQPLTGVQRCRSISRS